jgi:threonine/homoserine/homoserine lactone efflux protein
MDITIPLLSILGAIVVGAASPGPSFVFVTRTAIALSRRDGLAAALGMGVGGVVYGGLGLFGLQAILAQVEWLYLILKVLGGLYLLWLAVALWRTAAQPIAVPKTAEGRPRSVRRSFTLAAVTQLSNPKAAVVYGSIFAAFLPPQVPGWTFAVLLPAIFPSRPAGTPSSPWCSPPTGRAPSICAGSAGSTAPPARSWARWASA